MHLDIWANWSRWQCNIWIFQYPLSLQKDWDFNTQILGESKPWAFYRSKHLSVCAKVAMPCPSFTRDRGLSMQLKSGMLFIWMYHVVQQFTWSPISQRLGCGCYTVEESLSLEFFCGVLHSWAGFIWPYSTDYYADTPASIFVVIKSFISTQDSFIYFFYQDIRTLRGLNY